VTTIVVTLALKTFTTVVNCDLELWKNQRGFQYASGNRKSSLYLIYDERLFIMSETILYRTARENINCITTLFKKSLIGCFQKSNFIGLCHYLI
jgi:hypothetical protein